MPESVHVEPPEELREPSHDAVSPTEKRLELAAVFLLSIATLCIAWSGYQATRWSGLQAEQYAQAASAHTKANRSSTLAGQQRLQDLLNFNRWLEVSTSGNTQLADLYVRRFRPEFVPAFNAWVAQDALNNAKAVPTPLQMPQYKLAELEKSNRIDERGDAFFEKAKNDTEHTDDYVYGTLYFAAVLFFAGISMRFEWLRIRISVIVLAGVFLLYGVIRLFNAPTH